MDKYMSLIQQVYIRTAYKSRKKAGKYRFYTSIKILKIGPDGVCINQKGIGLKTQ